MSNVIAPVTFIPLHSLMYQSVWMRSTLPPTDGNRYPTIFFFLDIKIQFFFSYLKMGNSCACFQQETFLFFFQHIR